MNDIPLGVLFGILLLLLFLSAFFSGSETALMALNRYRAQHLADGGHRGARLALKLLEKPDRLIGVILLGNNFVNILITQLSTYIGFIVFGDIGVAIATGILILVLLIFAEVAPKTLGALHAERVAFPAAFVYRPLLTLTYPLVWSINLLANSMLKMMGVPAEQAASIALNRDELRSVVREAREALPSKHRSMLLGVLDLEKTTVEDIMIPRNEITGIDLDDDWDEVLEQLASTAYTRRPVFRGSIDSVVGTLHMGKILPLLAADEFAREELESTLAEPYFIPEGTTLTRQLINFQREKSRIGLVVDEYGDIMGLVTMEDLLEEIVGEFTTDPLSVAKDIHPRDDGSYVIDGGTQIREINRALGWELNAEGPRTLNGVLLEYLEYIPEPGTSMLIDGHPVEVVQTKNNAVKTVLMQPRLARFTPPADDDDG